MQKHTANKPGTPCLSVPSKAIITNWLKSLFPDLSIHTKIEDFGDGVIYCRLLNHYFGNPPHVKITWSPKNQYQYMNNLKHVQTALLQLGITIPFDVNRVAKRKFLQNWALINSFYKHFNSAQEIAVHQQYSNSSHGNHLPHIMNPINYTGLGNVSHNMTHHGHNNYLNQNQKTLKRPHQQGDVPSSFKDQNSALIHPQNLSWDRNIPLNLGILAQNSLQISQLFKQNLNSYNTQNSPAKGKWSVGSQIFQNNYHIVIDRIKEILLKGSHDTEKIRQIKMLLGITLQEEQVIKIEDDDTIGTHILYKQSQVKIEKKLQKQQVNQCKQPLQILQKQISHNRQAKASVCKSGKKPFKI